MDAWSYIKSLSKFGCEKYNYKIPKFSKELVNLYDVQKIKYITPFYI